MVRSRGRLYQLNQNWRSLFESLQIEEGVMVMEDDSPEEAVTTPNTPRNLAAWKISIPYVDFFDDPSLERKDRKERIPVFCIDVERNDRRAGMQCCGEIKHHLKVNPEYSSVLCSDGSCSVFCICVLLISK